MYRRFRRFLGRRLRRRPGIIQPDWAFEDGITIRLSGNPKEPHLASLFARFGSDKGWAGDGPTPFFWVPHNYADMYEFLFRSRRMSVRTVVECGIGTNNTDVASNMTETGRPGASLRAWRDYFPNAMVLGLDIDERILFEEERIATYQVDQTDRASINRFWAQAGVADVDIMIDDGLHTFEAGKSLFEASIARLSPDGIYIIEDVSPNDLQSFRDFFAECPHLVDFVQIERPRVPLSDNSLVIIRPQA